jgi:AcrR family transcriptional regulator
MVATPAGDTATSIEIDADGASTLRIEGGPAPLLIDGRVAPVPGPAPDESLESRILDATLVCVARWGVAKTTLDDIARAAGCGRATVYRVLPGGKDALMLAAADRELQRFLVHLSQRLAAEGTLAGRLAIGIAEAARVIAGHGALQYLVEHEPEVVLPFVSFDAIDPLLHAAGSFGVDALGPFLEPAEARSVGEWVARIVLSYGFEPDDRVDLADLATASRFVHQYLPHLTPAGSPAINPADGRRTEKEPTHVNH